MSTPEARAIVDDIKRLHEVATPIAVIAHKLHLPVRLIQHVVQHGHFPAAQPQWKHTSEHIEA